MKINCLTPFESNIFLKKIKDILDNNMTLREKEEIIETLAVDYEYKVFKNLAPPPPLKAPPYPIL